MLPPSHKRRDVGGASIHHKRFTSVTPMVSSAGIRLFTDHPQSALWEVLSRLPDYDRDVTEPDAASLRVLVPPSITGGMHKNGKDTTVIPQHGLWTVWCSRFPPHQTESAPENMALIFIKPNPPPLTNASCRISMDRTTYCELRCR